MTNVTIITVKVTYINCDINSNGAAIQGSNMFLPFHAETEANVHKCEHKKKTPPQNIGQFAYIIVSIFSFLNTWTVLTSCAKRKISGIVFRNTAMTYCVSCCQLEDS